MKNFVMVSMASILLTACLSKDDSSSEVVPITTKAQLGEVLFHDKNLSLNRSQSCATCHNPDQGFADDRLNDASRDDVASAGSLGDDDVSIGDRNAPSAGYAAFSRDFKLGTRSRVASQNTIGITDYEGYLEGQFWDGRAATLADQAAGPPLNPAEMGMPDEASVVERIKENARYIEAFETLYAADVFDDVSLAYAAMTNAIESFEETTVFYPFDSKYDRSLTGEYTYDPLSKARPGKTLLLGSDSTCAACHQKRDLGSTGEIFTGFEYHNIGVPENVALRAINKAAGPDLGLFNNPAVNGDEEQKGKFKTPTLRNIAVTAPYMHNGIFNELETVIKFYQHATARAKGDADIVGNENNPETNLPWADPEVDLNIEHDILGKHQNEFDDDEIEQIVCFLMSLTDQRYEHLLDQAKVQDCGL